MLFFLLYILIPGDPARMMLGQHPNPQILASVRHQLGLDRPIYIQYLIYLKRLLSGNLGTSYRYKVPVSSMIADYLPATFKLALAAVFIESILGITAGIISSLKRYSYIDVLITISTTILVCIPVFWLGMILQLWFGVKWRLLPVAGYGNGDIPHLILPAFTLAAVSTAAVARLVRSSMLEVADMDFIRTARAKGLPNWKIVLKHQLRNALIPTVTFIGMDLGALMAGAIVTEIVFSWPGIGRMMYNAILARDNPVVISGILIMVVIFIVANLLVDISYTVLDPRVRLKS